MRQSEGREVVIVEAVRTPIGRGHKEKGYYKDTHPNTLLAKTYTEVVERSGIDPLGGRGRDRRVRPAVRRAGLQHRPQRLAAGGPADRDPRHHRRPPVRLGPAGRQLLSRPDRGRGPRRDDRLGRGAHGPSAVLRRHENPGGVRLRLHPRADGQAQHHRPGPRRGDDRRPVGDPPLRARRARTALPPPRRPGHRGGPLRARDRADAGQRRHARDRPGDPSRHQPRGALPAEARVQGGRQDHRRQLLPDLRRRRGRAADVRRQGQGPRSEGPRRGSPTRPPSAATP